MLSLPLEYERVEPSSGADPDHRPYEGQATAVCDGVKLPGEASNFHCEGQGPEACQLADPALRASGKIGCECRPSGPARAAVAGRTGSNLSGFLPNANSYKTLRAEGAIRTRTGLRGLPAFEDGVSAFPPLPHRGSPRARTSHLRYFTAPLSPVS